MVLGNLAVVQGYDLFVVEGKVLPVQGDGALETDIDRVRFFHLRVLFAGNGQEEGQRKGCKDFFQLHFNSSL